LGIEQDFWASRYNITFFKNSAQPGGVLETSGNLTDEEYQRVLAQWQDRHGGASKAHAITLLEGGLSYKQTGLSQKDTGTGEEEALVNKGHDSFVPGSTRQLKAIYSNANLSPPERVVRLAKVYRLDHSSKVMARWMIPSTSRNITRNWGTEYSGFAGIAKRYCSNTMN
jgi:hypothetical protein